MKDILASCTLGQQYTIFVARVILKLVTPDMSMITHWFTLVKFGLRTCSSPSFVRSTTVAVAVEIELTG